LTSLARSLEDAESREELRELLARQSGGVIFTTMQKFSPEKGEERFPTLTDRRNVIVIADEAHRSQYGLDAKVSAKTGERKYGYAAERLLRWLYGNAH
jgi:type I restriction enzyme R subunit